MISVKSLPLALTAVQALGSVRPMVDFARRLLVQCWLWLLEWRLWLWGIQVRWQLAKVGKCIGGLLSPGGVSGVGCGCWSSDCGRTKCIGKYIGKYIGKCIVI